MELIIGGIFLLVVMAVAGIYLSDRQGWNYTFKRLARISRASLEARSFKSLERIKTGDKDRWEAAFTGKPDALTTITKSKHEIIKHDYYETYLGGEFWPRWTCKCGSSDKVIPLTGILWFAERSAARQGRSHVRKSKKIDRRLDTTNNKFMF